jgi:hypothetical protein
VRARQAGRAGYRWIAAGDVRRLTLRCNSEGRNDGGRQDGASHSHYAKTIAAFLSNHGSSFDVARAIRVASANFSADIATK